MILSLLFDSDYIIIFSHPGATPRYNAFYGQGSGPIWLDDLLCTGREQRLVDCPVSTGGIGMVDFCNGHADDAGVTCQLRKSKW